MKTTMKLTAIIGAAISVIFAIFADFDNAENIVWYVYAYYPLVWLIICTVARKCFEEPVWVATVVTSPIYIGLFGMLLISVNFFVKFACFGVTLSLLILEYKIMRR